jgi:hypothetical protein
MKIAILLAALTLAGCHAHGRWAQCVHQWHPYCAAIAPVVAVP